MRIFVVEPLGQGGLIHYSYHLCRALQAAGADVTLLTSTDYELENLEHNFKVNRRMKLWNARQKDSVNEILRKIRRVGRGLQYVLEWLRLIIYLRREKPDIVWFGEIRFAFEYYFLKMLKASGLKIADIVHDVRTYDTSKSSDTILQEDQKHLHNYERIYQTFDALFVHDRSNYELFLEIFDIDAEKVTEIPHGANEIVLEMTPSHTVTQLRELYGLKEGEQVVLFFGTVTKYKGCEDLIEAFPQVAHETNAKLLVAGYPAKDIDPDELKASTRAYGIADSVKWFLDYVPNEQIVPLMQLADVVAMPYRAISQSGILQIAYACGVPVVATRVGGLPDVIEHESSGLLVEPENKEALAAGLIRILKDDDLRQRMALRARELAENRYSWRYVASLVLPALEKAAKSSSSPSN